MVSVIRFGAQAGRQSAAADGTQKLKIGFTLKNSVGGKRRIRLTLNLKKKEMVNLHELKRLIKEMGEKEGENHLFKMSLKNIRRKLMHNLEDRDKSSSTSSSSSMKASSTEKKDPIENEKKEAICIQSKKEDQHLPSKSMYAPEEESANTKVCLAPSFSGKTTLMVNELNKLTKKELMEYDKIVLFTESLASAPLKKLEKKVLDRLLMFDRFLPKFVLVLKKINNATNNRFRFLLLLDDCLNLKSDVLIKLILTLRNANISTVINIQYSKLLSKSQRQSIHDYFLINLKLEDLEYLMSGFLASHFRKLFEEEGSDTRENISKWNYKKLAEKAMERLKDKILQFDQRHDKIIIFHRNKS